MSRQGQAHQLSGEGGLTLKHSSGKHQQQLAWEGIVSGGGSGQLWDLPATWLSWGEAHRTNWPLPVCSWKCKTQGSSLSKLFREYQLPQVEIACRRRVTSCVLANLCWQQYGMVVMASPWFTMYGCLPLLHLLSSAELPVIWIWKDFPLVDPSMYWGQDALCFNPPP